MPAQSSDPSHRKDRDKDKIYIGILTAELGNHVVSLFLDSFLEHYDATRFHLSLISTCRWHQSREKSLIDKADEYITVEGLSDAEARIQIRSLDLDIVIETSGFTKDSRIEVLAERCAPVQCHYIGFHATTGFDTIDYVIGDEEVASAEFNQQFTEKLIRMPRAWLACRPFEQQPLAVATCTEPYPVMGCFSQLAKIRDETLTFWAAALKQVPDARLVIKDKLVNDDAARHRILASLASLGISDARIQFLPHSDTWLEHMRLYNSIDIALDTTPWGSSTTAFDALSMGVPLVAIRGNCMPARMSSSIVKAIGRAEWVSGSPDQFAQVVGGLCNDLPSLRASKGALQRHVLNGPLFDGADLSSHLQEVLTTLAGAEHDRVQHSDQTDA
jgi:predicted O-linked N-acetylglucosamine transferase (SPINDLY family)